MNNPVLLGKDMEDHNLATQLRMNEKLSKPKVDSDQHFDLTQIYDRVFDHKKILVSANMYRIVEISGTLNPRFNFIIYSVE